eukprot:5583287-Pyramimonas_sp.AAC.2
MMCFFSGPGGGAGIAAKDANGNDVKSAAWLATHQAGDRSLTQGLKVRVATLQVYSIKLLKVKMVRLHKGVNVL